MENRTNLPSSGTYPNEGAPPADHTSGSKMSGLAVASLIFGLTGCLSIGGVILGISALREIKRDGSRGRGLAITGIVLGGLINGAAAILIILSFVFGS